MRDGWNEDRLDEVMEVLGRAYDTRYEIDCCRRGCYTGAETYEELAQHLHTLADMLHDAADGIGTEEDEDDEEEEDEE